MESQSNNPVKPKMKNSKFRYIPGKTEGDLKKKTRARDKFDPKCQEATPEILRIEIEQIFKEFLGNPDEQEYIFPPDLNNLQRKFIHNKAQALNITSKSYGKEPNRRIHLKKKKNQLSNMSFNIVPGKETTDCVKFFKEDIGHQDPSFPINHKHADRNTNRLWNSRASVPASPVTTNYIDELRSNLPIYGFRADIISAIEENDIVILSSETGSGKTTQVPQYIMELMTQRGASCKIICTQPRRISTVAAAERVAFERGERVGSSVGYHIRLEQKYGLKTNLIYCTTGVFVRNLMSGGKSLANITHIILDEIHERDKLTDFVLICLKQMLPSHPKLKIILMSATVSAEKFKKYFGSGHIMQIPGRLFPISVSYLEDILVDTGYKSPRMKALQAQEEEAKQMMGPEQVEDLHEVDEAVDEALQEYLNFCEDYDYKVHYEEATAQLGMYFLSEGVSVNYKHSKNGRTALMIASHLGDKEFITRLCNMGADMEICDNLGKSAVDYARDNPEILNLLEYISSHREKMDSNERDKKAQKLLELYDKTTSEDFIDFDLLVTLIICIHKASQPGSILVFLPGYDHIMMCNDRLLGSTIDPTTIKIFFLHSSMNIRDQHDVFKKIPNMRKIILSTNIAETSLTIDDVVFVIDIGKGKEKCYDSYNKVSSLQTRWISQACAEQRKGRAGRTSPGMVFRLYSKQRYDNMDPERVPEMLRISLEEICLHAKILAPEDMNIHNFLMMALDAPSDNSIKVAIENLQFLGALDKEEDLTALGRYLAQLATEPHLGKILIYSVIFRCLEPVLTLVASMSHKDPFQLPPQANLRSVAAELRKSLLNGYKSDHLMHLKIFREWQIHCIKGTGYEFCKKYFISYPTMNSILETRSQLLAQLRSINFIHQSSTLDLYNLNASSWPVVKAVIATGLYPNLAYPMNGYLANRREKKVSIQNGSSCHNKPVIGHWLMYDEMVKQVSNMYIKGVSPITTLTVSLMCGNDVIYPTPNTILIDDWIEFQYPFPELNNLRKRMEFLIKTLMIMPSYRFSDIDLKVIKALRNVLNIEENVISLPHPAFVGEKPRFLLPLKEYENRPQTNLQKNKQPQRENKAAVRVQQYRESSIGQQMMSFKTHNGINIQNYRSNRVCENVYSNENTYPRSHYSEYNHQNGVILRSTNGFTRNESDSPTDSLSHLGSQDSQSSWDPVHGDLDPATRLLNGLTRVRPKMETAQDLLKKYSNYPDRDIYVLIRPKSISNVKIAFGSSKWIFAPQTEKKILHFFELHRRIFVVYTVPSSNAFQGVAKFISIASVLNEKPTATIQWIHQGNIFYDQVHHLKNPYNGYRPIFSGQDGQVIEQKVAENLCRIFEEQQQRQLDYRNSAPSTSSSGRQDLRDNSASSSRGGRPLTKAEKTTSSSYQYWNKR